MTNTMTIKTPAFQADVFFSLGYAEQLANALQRGRTHAQYYHHDWRLNSSLRRLLVVVRDFDFDPKAKHAPDLLKIMQLLHSAVESLLEKREQCFSDADFLKHWFRSIKRHNRNLGTIIESWELATNERFNSLVSNALESLESGKSSSDWRTSLAELNQD